MELSGYGFEKSELLRVTEELYALKSKKQEVELKLQSEKFHQQYIPKRKALAEHEVTFRLLWIIPITLLVLGASVFLVYYYIHSADFSGDWVSGVIFLFSALVVVFCGYTAYRLWKREIQMFRLLLLHKNSEKAANYSKKHDLNTFQHDENETKNRIDMLEGEIEQIAHRMSQLEEKQDKLLEDKRTKEDFLKNRGVLFDENPNQKTTKGKFSLREESIAMGGEEELLEFYNKELQYLHQLTLQLEGQLQHKNNEISKIDDDFENVKKILLFVVIIYVLMVIIQSAFSGVLGSVTKLLCIIFFYGCLFKTI